MPLGRVGRSVEGDSRPATVFIISAANGGRERVQRGVEERSWSKQARSAGPLRRSRGHDAQGEDDADPLARRPLEAQSKGAA